MSHNIELVEAAKNLLSSKQCPCSAEDAVVATQEQSQGYKPQPCKAEVCKCQISLATAEFTI